jgi:hypothetical protein
MLRQQLLALVAVAGIAAFSPLSIGAAPLDYNRDIRPIVSNLCNKCHGFDGKERKAELRLDSEEGQRMMLPSGMRAVVPGDLAASELYARIISTDPNEVMPPPATGKKVTPEQVAIIKRWIEEGAAFQRHWAFETPKRPELPEVGPEAPVRNPIDRFIIARLAAEGLKPSAEADKFALIRRVTLDLTGLPPTPAEVDAFLADSSPDAYEKLVDRLLGSNRYAEQMSRYWLDAARYGDTHGLHLDNERSLWPYREWVINAFAKNQPFDQFTVEQLAGDLLPSPTIDQKIATGFNRCNVSTSEGGSIDEEVRVRYAVDRVETTATVWLGMTFGCAVCHDHKFDPISQKEFYGMFAFFNSVAENAMDGNALLPPPIMKLPTAEQTAKATELDAKIAELKKTTAEALAKVEYTETPEDAAAAAEAREFVWVEDEIPAGATPQGNTPWEFVTKAEFPVFSGERASKRKGMGFTQHFFTGANPTLAIGDGDKLFAYVYIEPTDKPKMVMLQFNDGSWEHRAIWGDMSVTPFGVANTPARVDMGPLPEAGSWVRLEVPVEKMGLKAGSQLNGFAFSQHDGTVYWDKAGIVTKTPQSGQAYKSLAAWEAFEKANAKSTAPQPVKDALKVELDKRTPEQTKAIRDYFLEYAFEGARPTFKPLHEQIAATQKERSDLEAAIPATMVMAENPQVRETFLLVRGAYDKKGDKVEPGTPAVFPPLPEGAPKTRLGLAQWLVQPSHPLTARVTVNRFWQQCFGTGLVKTAEDFGTQGNNPTHPELLDWLATEFVSSGWNVKQMLKLIVMSGTYRQSSRVPPELLARDPQNELLARAPRFRLDAEVIRDAALYSSGLLVERVGGKSVKPYQPEGIWEAVAFVGSNTSVFKRDAGDALYRRSLYTFWKRTSPPPSLLTFDAPSRENCTVRRARTNTPLQALVLMNDTQYVEAARKLAETVLSEPGLDLPGRLAFAFRRVLSRPPTPEELSILQATLQAQLAKYQADKDAATKLLSYGEAKRNEALDLSEHAAWTLLCNLLLNLDELVMRE